MFSVCVGFHMDNKEQLLTNFYGTELEPVCVWADMLVSNVVQVNLKYMYLDPE